MKRTPEKRQAILDAAAEEFRDKGYERASMSDIGLRTGFSKTTLYGYFGAKEALLAALVDEATENGVAAMLEVLAGAGPHLAVTLERFAGRYLSYALSPSVCSLRRVLAAGAGRSELDLRCRDLGAARIDAALAGYLRAQMEAGALRGGDARGSAQQFRALLEASWFDRVLFDYGSGPGPGQVEEEIEFALAAFLRAWAPALPVATDAS
ncbi:TetR/AcrR family transcriptional regulator [Massilia litorea]|uniref:TetR/AcrR family transcriptional regulator n=1 Tax=Massilia litorea TaxID=2769491 RepID=A0A7L9U3H3_9BURK|nr:TetR/AcrR family transcriptional regulator [Massilia litorea]QOL48665.1 TetR/AcrR family transcriptional regulator [Massilia litorea]